MGFRFRKSINLGPARINLSKSGVGYSFGGKGFRVTKKAGGGTRTTASIPGTGFSYVKDSGKKSKKSTSVQTTGGAGSPPGGYTYTPSSSSGGPKKPFHKRWWFWVIAVLLALTIIGGIFGEDTTNDPQPTETVTVTVEPTATPEPTPEPTATPTPTPQPTPVPTPIPTVAPTPEPTKNSEPTEALVWVSENGNRYHSKSSCSGMIDPYQVPISQAEAMGRTPCQRCY